MNNRGFVPILLITLMGVLANAAFAVPPQTSGGGATDSTLRGRIAVSADGLALDIGQVEILSQNVYDYTFTSAPTDWIPRAGTWKPTNRWDCSAQWSWYGGYDPEGLAATWNKHQFLGDITVEIYAAMKMGVGVDRRYKNPNDMNITFHGDGENLDSGYSFIMGGELNTYSRIMKGNVVLAETRDEGALFPIFEDSYPSNINDFHRKWWGLRARLSGHRLQFYKDEKLILEAEDPDPLPGGRVALWTMHNGIVVSRVKIYYESEKIPPDPIPSEDILRVPAHQNVDQRAIEVHSDSHPAIYDDFETDVGNWRTYGGNNGARITLVSPGADGTGHALALINQNSGGCFGARLRLPRLDARKYGHLTFDYNLDPDVRLNLYCAVNSGLYEIVFTADECVGPQAQILTRIPNVRADGKWHSASVDLITYLERLYGSDEEIWIEDVYFANTHTEGYIHAGFGGNHAGATLQIDNFYLGGVGSKDVSLTWTAYNEAEVQDCAYVIDQEPYTEPQGEKMVGGAELADSVADSGIYYAHMRPKLADGTWGPTLHYRMVVDDDPPCVTSRSPEGGQASGSPIIAVGLSDPGGSGIDTRTVKMVVQGREFPCDGTVLRYDIFSERLIFDAGAAGLVFQDGERVAVQLAAVKDRLGHGLTRTTEWEWRYVTKRDKTPPTTPDIRSEEDYLCRDDFETGLSQWSTFGGVDGALVCQDPSTAATGQYSLRLYNYRQGGRFGAYIRKESFDAGKYRLMSFDYKVPGRLRADFGLYINGRWQSIRFTDTDSTRYQIGEIPGVQMDGEWHHVEVNLFELLRRANPQTSNYTVRYLILADWGWMGNAEGRTYYIDNFHLIPVSNAANGLKLTWDTRDASGIAGASYLLDRLPNSDPGKKKMVEGTSVTLQPEIDGDCYVHVRSVDGAGNWSEPGHLRLIIDRGKPTVALVSPQPNQRVATSRIVFDLVDVGPADIDPASLRLKVNGQQYDTRGGYLAYDAEAKKLIWDGNASTSRPIAFEDGKTVTVELLSAADFVGNEADVPPAFSWTMDYTCDTEPPLLRTLKSTTHLTLVCDTFEENMGAWTTRAEQGGTALSLDETDAGGGARCLKIVNEQAGGAMAVTAWAQEFSADRYPDISFDYNLDPGVKLDLLVFMNQEWHAIGFTDRSGELIGTIDGAVADGRWHHASISLGNMLRAKKRNGPLNVEQVVFSDRGNLDNAVGATARLDNFLIGRVGKSSPTFTWKATDATGITDYSYVLDRNPATIPDEIGEGTATTKIFRGIEGGRWYFHIRAKDGAGHWGPTAHYGILHMFAPPSA
ncbi:MAG: hypothetical protein ACUVX8_11685 [Candidatus Zipacnadales bacterium]